ncbi:MAG TPA: SIS domain-containing protein [bacterium]|jgi:D-sedoheptulose 7-phosphate isomerase
MNEPQISAIKKSLETAVQQAAEMHGRMDETLPALSAIAQACAQALRSGGTVYFCGNGGSAAESQHLATEFVVRLSSQRNRAALSSIALTTDTSLITACSNDLGFDKIYSRQIEAHLKAGDVLILLSTSGASPNLLEAASAARHRRGTVAAFVGEKQTPLDKLAHHTLHIPSPHSQRVQEGHLLCGHLLVEMVEDLLTETPSSAPENSR